MKVLRCLIVDDESLARAQLRALLEEVDAIEIAGEAANLQEALAAIANHQPDLVFLDIKMRGGGGFEILDRLEDPPAVIFVTAHDHFAVRAFEVNALDYLLKPVSLERLKVAIDKFRQQPAAANLPALQNDDLAFIRLGSSGQFTAVQDILFIRSNGHYSEVCCANSPIRLVRQSFRSWLTRLPEAMFAQLDRGLIVNRTRIKRFIANSKGAEVFFDGHDELVDVGSTASRRLRELNQ